MKNYGILCLLLLSGNMFAQSWETQALQLLDQLEIQMLGTSKNALYKKASTQLFSEKMKQGWSTHFFQQEGLPSSRAKPTSPFQLSGAKALNKSTKLAVATTTNLSSSFLNAQLSLAELSLLSLPSLPEKMLQKLNMQASYNFYGKSVLINYDGAFRFSLKGGSLTKSRIIEKWRQMENAQHTAIRYQLMQQSSSLNLNDWGFCQLVNTTAKQIYPGDQNAQTLFNFFCFSKAGYKAKISYNARSLFLLMPTKQRLYGASYLREGSRKYYVLDLNRNKQLNLRQAQVLDISYPNTEKILDFRIKYPMRLKSSPVLKTYSFKYAGKTYRFPIKINKNLVDFYRTYPFTDLDIMLSAPMSRMSEQTLIPSLRKILYGKSEEASINFLLRFVQTAFPYKRDLEQFGKENYLFLEETFYYPYSDCEDRSVLFAYLVRKVLKLDVIGLIFPGHAATAVRFSRPTKGTYIAHKGKKYIICDPSYINAEYGRVLPDVANKKARIIDF